MKKSKTKKSGKVYLVGAGPGDLRLLTLRAVELLGQADAVIHDRLLNQQILKFAPQAKKIYVGKDASLKGPAKSFTQEQINRILLKNAGLNKCVVRLKGGDPFVFGRGGEEATYLKGQGIAYEVVPGVSAGIAAAAYAGIPMTDRRKTSMVTFVTAHQGELESKSSLDWAKLAKLDGTLVIYMGVRTMQKIQDKLLAGGMSPQEQVSIIERATFPDQRICDATLKDMAQKAKKMNIQSPAIIVVGKVNALRKKIDWFKPAKKKLSLAGKTVLITRARTQASQLRSALEEKGANVIEFPVIRIEPPLSWAPLETALRSLEQFDWVVFTSVNAVTSIKDRLRKQNLDARSFAGVKIAAIGEPTAKALLELGLRADLMPEEYTSEGLIKAFRKEKIQGKHFLLPRTDIAPEYLNTQLETLGASVKQVVAYRTVSNLDKAAKKMIDRQLSNSKIDYVTFTSSSTVQNFFKVVSKKKSKAMKSRFISIGPVTSRELRRYGFRPHREAIKHTIPGLVEVISRDQ